MQVEDNDWKKVPVITFFGVVCKCFIRMCNNRTYKFICNEATLLASNLCGMIKRCNKGEPLKSNMIIVFQTLRGCVSFHCYQKVPWALRLGPANFSWRLENLHFSWFKVILTLASFTKKASNRSSWPVSVFPWTKMFMIQITTSRPYSSLKSFACWFQGKRKSLETVSDKRSQKSGEKLTLLCLSLLPEPWIGVQLAKDVGVSDLTQEGVNFWKWVSLCTYTFIQFG